MKIKVVWTLLSSCVPGSRTGSSYRAVILLMQFHIDPNWSCNNLKRAYLCQAERVSFSTDVINLKETWSSWCWKCLHFPISNWLGTIAWALYLACKSFILSEFCYGPSAHEVEGLMAYVRSLHTEGTATGAYCRHLFLLLLPSCSFHVPWVKAVLWQTAAHLHLCLLLAAWALAT